MSCSAARWAVVVFMALGVSASAGEVGSVWIDKLGAADRLEVRTPEHVLRFDLVDPSTGEALAALSRDGLRFGPADRVFLLGATSGRHPEGLMTVRMGRVEVGKRLELAVHTMDAANRRVTGPVQSVRVSRPATAVSP